MRRATTSSLVRGLHVDRDVRHQEAFPKTPLHRIGPDGLLYITTDGGGQSGEILRVTPLLTPEN